MGDCRLRNARPYSTRLDEGHTTPHHTEPHCIVTITTTQSRRKYVVSKCEHELNWEIENEKEKKKKKVITIWK